MCGTNYVKPKSESTHSINCINRYHPKYPDDMFLQLRLRIVNDVLYDFPQRDGNRHPDENTGDDDFLITLIVATLQGPNQEQRHEDEGSEHVQGNKQRPDP